MKISNKELEEAKAKLHEALNGPIYNHWCYRPYVQTILSALDSAESELATVRQAQQELIAEEVFRNARESIITGKPLLIADINEEELRRECKNMSHGVIVVKKPAPIITDSEPVAGYRKLFTCSACGAEGLDEPLESRCHCSEDNAHWVESRLYTTPPAPAVLPDHEPAGGERAAYEVFMANRFPFSIDQRRAQNGTPENPDYMAWVMTVGWIAWQARAAVAVKSPVIPDGWARVPTDATRAMIAAAPQADHSEQQLYMASAAARDVLNERQRQIMTERFTPERDDTYTDGELVRAAVTYAYSSINCYTRGDGTIEMAMDWPLSWDESLWKPTGTRRDLVKAGALILAEIERLDRLAEKTGKQDKDVTPTGAI
ncbi:hypothetical protein [Dickeya chrysanthemi]|uniref:hypothetical protein n=1 Tax=Dickeya chrysanthemi TaxID=556 RepID=UPI003AFA2D44